MVYVGGPIWNFSANCLGNQQGLKSINGGFYNWEKKQKFDNVAPNPKIIQKGKNYMYGCCIR